MMRVFLNHSVLHKMKSMLKWMQFTDEEIKFFLKEQNIIKKERMEKVFIPESFKDNFVNYTMLKLLCNDESYQLLSSMIDTKRKNEDYFCAACKKRLPEGEWVCCDSCIL